MSHETWRTKMSFLNHRSFFANENVILVVYAPHVLSKHKTIPDRKMYLVCTPCTMLL